MLQHEDVLAKRYFEPAEIEAHLLGVEYVIMAAPAPDVFKETPIHFTIFLNTRDVLPEEIKTAVLEKFCSQYNITATAEVLSSLQAVAFAKTSQESPMPVFLVKPEDRMALPHTTMHVIDFLGDSPDFKETKEQNLTGWSYSYND